MPRYLFLCLCGFLFFNQALFAQGENNVWTFGHHNGLDFNNNPPTFFQSSNTSLEGCASVADAAGNLLFYSNGNDVWNAAGTVMPNGSGIIGNGPGIGGMAPGSCAQGVAIVKSLSNSNRYYLFTLDAAEQIDLVYLGYLRYSVIDMSLNGGTGDVVAGQKNIVLDSAMSEKMTVAKGAGCYYWLIAHRHNSQAYRAFKIDAAGIHPAVASNGSMMGNIGAGQLKVSPDGTRIAASNSLTGTKIEVGTFDNATGIISNTVLFDSVAFLSRLGTCFSPDNTKLYIGSFVDIAQYDLSAYPNAAAILASKVVLNTGVQYCDLRNGPDGKIYGALYQTPFLAVINNPNTAGMACNLNTMALPQPAWAPFPAGFGSPYGYGLGNDNAIGAAADTTVNSSTDTLICFEPALDVSAPPGYTDYLWNDGTATPARTLSADGTYWVYSYESCSITVDSFKVKFVNLDADLGPDTAICTNSRLLLNVSQPGATYAWQDGSSNASFVVTGKGAYSVTISKESCSKTDSIIISTFEPYLKIKENDTLICNDESLVLHAIANPISNYQWSNGSITPDITVNKAGSYTVTATNACGTFKDSVSVTVENCDCRAFIPNAFSPNGDQNNDEFKMRTNCNATNFTMSIYNRYGQRIFQTQSPDKGWDGTFNGNPMDVGTYFFYARYKGPRGDDFVKKGDIVLIR